MFTANSMNCLTEALGLSLPGNGTVLATHKLRTELFRKAAKLIVKNAREYYFNDNEAVLPRSVATRAAFPERDVDGYRDGGRRIPCCTCWRLLKRPAWISR